MVSSSLRLGVNIDHVATLRQARYRTMPGVPQAEPSVVEASRVALAAGAHSITIHLRSDRRHIQDADVWMLRSEPGLVMNLEMGNTEEILKIAMEVRPEFVCMVPENREEVTTEGGLDVIGQMDALKKSVGRLNEKGIRVSLFIDPEPSHVRAAAKTGAGMIELHTGKFANQTGMGRSQEVERLVVAAKLAHSLGLQVNAGHGLTISNLPELLVVPHLAELNIGHHIVSRALRVGLGVAVREMLMAMSCYQV